MTELRVRAWQQMGLPFSLHVRGASAHVVDEAASKIKCALHRADLIFSTYRPDSDIMCARAGTVIELLHPAVAEVLRLAATASNATGGLFDVRSGPRLDPSGLVKGWAAANAFATGGLASHDAYLNAGGDLVLTGGPWRLGVEHPADPSGLLAVLSVNGGAVATSGSVHRGEHLWDPRTGDAARSRWQATVIGPELLWADVLATTAAVAGPDELDRSGWPAGYDVMLCSPDAEVVTSHDFCRHFVPQFAPRVSAEIG